MSRTPRELWANLGGNPEAWGGPVFPVTVVVEVEGTSTDTIPIFTATRRVAVRRASMVQEQSPDGAKTLKLRNLTDSEDITDAVDSDALAADTNSDFTPNDNADLLEDGDVLGLVYTVSTAGTTAPKEVVVVMEVEFLEALND